MFKYFNCLFERCEIEKYTVEGIRETFMGNLYVYTTYGTHVLEDKADIESFKKWYNNGNY